MILVQPTELAPGEAVMSSDELARRFPSVDFDFTYYQGNWEGLRNRQVSLADVVVLLAGGKGTRDVFQAVKRHDKLVLPIPFFGGSATECFRSERQFLLAEGLTEEDLASLAEGFDAAKVIELASSLLRRENP